MKSVFIIGASGHAKVIIDIIEKQKKYLIKGIIDINTKKNEDFFGYKVLGDESDLIHLIKDHDNELGIIAIGENNKRKIVRDKVKKIIPGFRFISVVHPSAVIARDVTIGNGTCIMAGAVVNSSSTIGEGCIINTNSSVDHDCNLGNFSSISPGVNLGGGVSIGDLSAVSIGATVLPKIKISEQCVIGAGSVVTKDISSSFVAYGIPARIIRKTNVSDNYLSRG